MDRFFKPQTPLKNGNGDYIYPLTLAEQVVVDPVTNERLPSKIADIVYPVGSIYMSVNNVDPSTLFGGTWERLSGGFLYGAQSDYSSFGNGTGTSTNSHTLTVSEMPKHSHAENIRTYGYPNWASFTTPQYGMMLNYSSDHYFGPNTTKPSTTISAYASTNDTGGGGGHSHAIPFMSVLVWKRTA